MSSETVLLNSTTAAADFRTVVAWPSEGDSVVSHICEFCGELFKSASDLEVHRQHSEKRWDTGDEHIFLEFENCQHHTEHTEYEGPNEPPNSPSAMDRTDIDAGGPRILPSYFSFLVQFMV